MSKHLKRRVTTCALGLTALMSQSAGATDKELLDILLANQKISKAQYDYLMDKEKMSEADKKELASSDVEVSLKKGLKIQTKDGDMKFQVGGRLHAQAAYNGDNTLGANDGTEIRRGRLFVKGVLFKDFNFKAQYDFADNKVGVKDLFVSYSGLDWFDITVGHQKQTYSLQLMMSSNDMPFVERSIDNAFAEALTDRAIGVRFDSEGDIWSVQTGFYGGSVGASDKSTDDEGWGYTARGILAPIHTENQLVHLGGAVAYRVPDDQADVGDSPVRFRSETTHMSNLYLVDTGEIEGVSNIVLASAEGAFVHGPFSLVGEYHHAFVNRDGNSDLDFNGWHVESTWSLTGESRAASYELKYGVLKYLKPAKSFSLKNGGIGAWELAARIAEIDLNDGPIDGGKELAFTGGINWYLNNNVRVMADYSKVLDLEGGKYDGNSAAEDLDIVELRTQLTF